MCLLCRTTLGDKLVCLKISVPFLYSIFIKAYFTSLKKECFELKKFMEYMLDGKQTQNVMHGENILIMSKMFYYPIRETVTYFHSTSHRTLLVPQSHLNYIA